MVVPHARDDRPVQGVHLELAGGQLLLLLLQLESGNAKLLSGEVQLGLQLPRLRHQLVHLVLGLGRPQLRKFEDYLIEIEIEMLKYFGHIFKKD